MESEKPYTKENPIENINWENLSQVAVFDGGLGNLSSDGNQVCLAFPGGKIEVRKVSDTMTEGLLIENRGLWASTFNSNGDFILARNLRNDIDISNESKHTSRHFKISDQITTNMSLSGDGRFLAYAYRNGACILDTENSDNIVKFQQDDWKYGEIFFSSTGNLLATKNQEGTFKLLDRESKSKILEIQGEESKVRIISFSSDDSLFAIGAENGKIAILKTTNGENIGPEINIGSEVTQIQFLNDNKNIATFSRDGIARVYNVYTGVLITKFLPGNNTIEISISEDGSRIAAGSIDSKTRIFDTASRKERLTISDRDA